MPESDAAAEATEAYTGADLVAEALADYGVEHVFGNPGTTELPIVEALGRYDVEYVLGLHEDVAVGAAAGYASTQRYHSHHDETVTPLGVANLHVTPGVAHGLGNLFGASYSGSPLLVTAGNHERDFRTEEPILTGDLEAMTDQFCKWATEALDPRALPRLVRRAARVALTPPTGPVFLALPLDVMQTSLEGDLADVRPARLGAVPDAGDGDPDQVARAADLLVDAESPVLVLGDGVARADAVEEALALAEATGARVHDETLACEVNFPHDHEQYLSQVPPEPDMARMLLQTDTIAFVGTSTNTPLLRHEEPIVDEATTLIHVSQDAWEVGKNHPADAAVVGDPGRTMTAITTRVREALSEGVRESRLASVRATIESIEPTVQAMGEDTAPDDPRASKAELVDALRAVAPEAYLVEESVTAKYALLTRWSFDAEGLFASKSGGLGYGVPAAVGAALAESRRPDPRPTMSFVGDGGYLYYPQAVYTAVRLGLDLTVVIADNRTYHILERNADDLLGPDASERVPGLDIDPAVDLVASAESYGATGHRVETPDALEDTLRTAVDADGVDVVDVQVHD
jgi:benzoylformate decarboxylase